MDIFALILNLGEKTVLPRLSDLQDVFIRVIMFLWTLTPVLSLFNLTRWGFTYMVARGSEKQVSIAREGMSKVMQSLFLIFGAYILSTVIINLLGVKDAVDCFKSTAKIQFVFVFPVPCSTN